MNRAEYKLLWSREHPELRKAQRRRYYLKHKFEILAKNKQWAKGKQGVIWRKKQEKKYGIRYPTWWLCDICSKPISLFKRGDIHLDHDHKTGLFRGWLCFHCNADIGRLEIFAEATRRYLGW